MHAISVYLVKKEELRNEKIDSVLENSKVNSLKFTELGCGILAATDIPNIKEFGKNKSFAKIETDYFGGFGEQSSKFFINNEMIYDKCSNDFSLESYDKNPINSVLKMMGVVSVDDKDEFDTIGLGNYRTNKDFK